MSNNSEAEDEATRPDAFRAVRKAERREQRRKQTQAGPVVARYGIWTGEGFLREGEGLEKTLAEQSLKLEGQSRRTKRRQRKSKKK
jgi:hypothetical protein